MTPFAASVLTTALAASLFTGLRADPARAAAELLAADRALGRAAIATDYRSAFAALFAPDVIMPSPATGGFAEGREAVLALLMRDTLNARSRVQWTPLRAGVSADGAHGATIGVMSVARPDGRVQEYKYLAYWERRPEGWRARVWRRIPRPVAAPVAAADARADMATAATAGDVPAEAPWLPRLASLQALEPSAQERALRELQGMERIFSDSAARIGIGPAFEALGADDAMHLGAPNERDFNRGNRVIAQAVQGNAPPGSSPVTWSAERAILAPSGDFGVTLGYIVPNAPAPDGSRRPFPFFTIWRREAGGWKYIAE